MPERLSAIDAISPAFERAKRELFQPFRWGFWLRMGLVAAASGEYYGSSGWGGFNFFSAGSHGGSKSLFQNFLNPEFEYLKRYLPLIVLGVLLLSALGFFLLYISSVFRFILFDSVLANRCEIKAQWRRWRSQGLRYFYWWICYGVAALAALGILVGGAVLAYVASGASHNPRQHVLLLVLGGAGLILALACVFLAMWLVTMFAKDFLVPVMALENSGVMDAWRRVIAMLKAEKGACAGYVVMKVILAVGCAILFGTLTLIALLALLIPISIAGFAAYFSLKAGGLLLNPVTIVLAVLAAALVVGLIIYVVSFVSSPAMVFFQAYVIHFLGSRYPPLGDRIAPLSGAPPAPAGASPAG